MTTLKPMPKREDFWSEHQGYEGVYTCIDDIAYERARADWLMENVVPLLREALDAWCGDGPPLELDRIDAVLRELEKP